MAGLLRPLLRWLAALGPYVLEEKQPAVEEERRSGSAAAADAAAGAAAPERGAAAVAGEGRQGGNDVVSGGQPPEEEVLLGWHRPAHALSLQEVNASVKVPPSSAPWFKKLCAFMGLGFVISVGYMDPGNWATDISAGAQFGYTLLVAILLSNFAAIFLQHLALKLGVVAERDLAQACRDAYPIWLNYTLWILAEIAIAACDLAEIIGSATALYLLFSIPLWAGVLITAADVLFILVFGTKNFRFLEAVVFFLCALIAGCFVYELVEAKPDWAKVADGLIPRPAILSDPALLYNAIGILGATVMPHNLYLHSSIIQTRAYERSGPGKRMAIKYGSWDSGVALGLAFFVNAAILTLAGAAFHYGPHPNQSVAYISDAYQLIAPALGQNAAKILFGVALLASGQNSTITGTLAGQVVMEGFIHVRLKPWCRRLLTRLIAIVPAAVVAAVGGNRGAGKLLVLSQVILSLQLTFAVAPLVHFTSSRSRMGKFVNNWIMHIVAVLLTLIIAGLNSYLVVQSIKDNEFGATSGV